MFKRKKEHKIFTSAVIVAGGSSTRMGENKLLMEINGISVIEKTLLVFENAEKISEIILVCRQEDFVAFSSICSNFKTPIKIVNGGQTRTHSTLNGINMCSENAQFIAIHDGARPLITEDIINEVIDNVIINNAVIPVVAVKDTIKKVFENIVSETPNRELLFSVQTPQIFKSDIIINAINKAVTSEQIFSDDASCVEALGIKVHTILGSYDNIKITTIEDIALASLIIDRRGF